MTDLTTDPRVRADSYTVYPSCWDELGIEDRHDLCLTVVDGHAWGWSIRRGMGGSGNTARAMNRKGEWVWESRGSGHNKPRRWELQEALAIALKHIDTMKHGGGLTAQEWAERFPASSNEEETE